MQKNYSKSIRDKSIDIAKGIGIILVVYGHLNCPIKNEIYLFHMPLFFFLSGYLFSNREPIKLFLIKKAKALLFPAILFYTISILITYSISNYNSLKEYVQSLNYFLEPNGVIWFLIALYQIFFIFYLVERYIHKLYLKILITLCITGIGYIMSIYKIFILYFPEACIGYIFFHLGFLTRKNNIIYRLNIRKHLIIGAFIGYILGIICNIQTDIAPLIIDSSYVLFLLPAIGGIILIIFLSKYIQKYKQSNWIAYVGKNSLLIMCMHIPLNSIVTYFLKYNQFPTLYELNYIWTFIFLVVSVTMSLLLGLIIKKVFPFCFNNR